MQFLDTAARFIFAVLVNGLWEAGVLALGAFLALRAMPKANATTRHAILAAALYASLILPVVTAAMTFAQPATNHALSTAGAVSAVQHAAHAPIVQHEPAQATQVPARTAFALPTQRPHFALPRFVAIAIVAAWLLGALIALARLLIGLGYLERLKRDSLPVPVEYRTRLERWTGAAKGARAVRLCRSHNILIPLAVGLFDAMILVPEHFLDELTPADIDRILLHELAHLRRNDDWTNVVERLAQAVFFFNPGILWLIAQLDLEREIACDDWVLQQSEALPYATCLEKVVTTALWPHRAVQAPGMFVTRRAMSVRIERLLSKHRDVRTSASKVSTGLVIAALTAVCVGALVVSPSFAYTNIAPPAEHIASASVKPSPRPVGASTQAPERVRTVYEYRDRFIPVQEPATAQSVTTKPKPSPAIKPQSVVAVASPPPPSPSATSDYVDELAAAGYTNLSVDDLIRMRAVGVTGPYIRDLANAGVAHLTPEQLVQFRAIGVNGDYIHGLASVGYSGLTFDQLRQLKALGIDAKFIQLAASHGFKNLPVEKLVELRGTGVLGSQGSSPGAAPDYVNELAGAGYTNLSPDDVIRMRAVGVTPAYIRDLASAGFAHLTPDQLVEFRGIGVTGDYIRNLASAGYSGLTFDQLRRLRALGIDADFVRLAASHGFKNLPVEKLVELKATGVLPQ
jgi:beta-lactamase regulating signal transducer with metallopeptidase domain